jgi:hypothetical protein
MNQKKAKLIRQLARAEGLPDRTAKLVRKVYANRLHKNIDRASFALLVLNQLKAVIAEYKGRKS